MRHCLCMWCVCLCARYLEQRVWVMCVYVSLWLIPNAGRMTLSHLEIFIFSALLSILWAVSFSDSLAANLGQSSFLLLSVHPTYEVEHYLISHWNTPNCATAGSGGYKTFDIIYINQPQEGRRKRGAKAWMKRKENEFETIRNDFTPILGVRRISFALIWFTLSSFLTFSLL